MKEGDIIVVGSDGLFDNLFDQEILDLLNLNNFPQLGESNLAEVVAKTAEFKSQSSFLTPFRSTAYELGLIDTPNGGKLDDITVIVSRVVSSNQPTSML